MGKKNFLRAHFVTLADQRISLLYRLCIGIRYFLQQLG